MQTLFSAKSPCITVAATQAALTAVALPAGSGNSIRIVNESADICFIALGNASIAATLPASGDGVSTCTPVLAGGDIIMRRNPVTDLYISTICRSGKTATLTVAIGDGGK